MNDHYRLPPELADHFPEPPSICRECMERRCRIYKPAAVVAVHCSHTATIAFVSLHADNPIWHAFAPFRGDVDELLLTASEEFKRLLIALTESAAPDVLQ